MTVQIIHKITVLLVIFSLYFFILLLALDTVFESNSDGEDTSDATVQERHYKALNKEQRKGKPNKSVINTYLNAEFASRRKYIETTPKEGRRRKILDDYPCLIKRSLRGMHKYRMM